MKPKAKPGELKLYWNRRECDIGYSWGGDGASKPDAHLMHGVFTMDRLRPNYRTGLSEFDPSFVKELERRGYDLTTIKFSIQQKPRT